MPLYYETTSYNSSLDGTNGTTLLSTLPTKKFSFFLYVLMIGWQESPMAIKKDDLPPFVKVKALLFFYTIWTN
jgi:hypothetical protein